MKEINVDCRKCNNCDMEKVLQNLWKQCYQSCKKVCKIRFSELQA